MRGNQKCPSTKFWRTRYCKKNAFEYGLIDYIKSNLIVEPQSLRPDFEELISYGPYGVTLVVSGEKIVPTYIGIFEPFYHGKVCQT